LRRELDSSNDSRPALPGAHPGATVSARVPGTVGPSMTDLRQHLDQARTLAHEGRYWAAIDTLEEARLRISRASADPWSPPEALADVLLEEMKLWCRVRWLADTDLPEAGERAMAVEQAMRGLLESANPLT